jgi:cytochrome c oxidase cbb3-type subunit 2
MYEVADPHVYISQAGPEDLQVVHHLKDGYTLLAFQESENVRIVAPKELRQYVSKMDEKLRLTSNLMLLRTPQRHQGFDGVRAAEVTQQTLQREWRERAATENRSEAQMPHYTILELYNPQEKELFSLSDTDGLTTNWVDEDYLIMEEGKREAYHAHSGVVFVKNPEEFRVSTYSMGESQEWSFDPMGDPIKSLEQLKSKPFNFLSRAELIQMGEKIFAAEGCWYCHTEQTRTLVQDTVVNGSDSYPAPPSTANEYVYQKITFPGTRRIGPDLSRVGVKRPSRDWHKSHFWSPKTESPGSIMPSFHHFFDEDPRGTAKSPFGVANYQFEAVFQYLMTKGTRITPPTQAWWLGKDPLRTIDIIEGKLKLKKS